MIRCALLLGQVPAGGESVLSPHESALMGPRAVPKRREDFLRGRWIAKQLLASARPGTSPEQYVILPDPLGVPLVHDSSLARLPFALSISHTEGLAMAALGESPLRVGVDVERPIERPDFIVKEYFAAQELSLCVGLAGHALQVRAALIWSVKEALMKALGEGLRITPTSVGLAGFGQPAGEWRGASVFLRAVQGDSTRAVRAWVKEGRDYVTSLVVIGATELEPPQVEVLEAT